MTEVATETKEEVQTDDGLLDSAELEKLVATYMQAAEGEERAMMAAFRAGTQLRLLAPADLYDVMDRELVRAPSGAILVVASHEGHVMIGQLSDNSHSIAVLYEEAHRWFRRKYFLPLSILVDREKVEMLEGTVDTASGRAVKGLEADGQAEDVAVAIRRVESLTMRDETSLLPRGTTLVLRDGATGKDVKTGDLVTLPPGAEVTVVAALGEFAPSAVDALESEIESLEESATPSAQEADDRVPADVIRVEREGRVIDLSSELLARLNPDTDILTWRELERRQLALESRRRFLRLAFAGGVAAAALGSNIPWAMGRKREMSEQAYIPNRELGGPAVETALEEADAEARTLALRETLRFAVPEVAVIYGLASAGGKYWYDVRGAVMDLEKQGSLETVRRMVDICVPLTGQLSTIWSAYHSSYYKHVHVGWTEHRHYRTDSKGRQEYSHSTWSKNYRWMWIEPGSLNGFHTTLSTYFQHATTYLNGSRELASTPLYDLLAANPDNAEATFRLSRIDLDNRRDMAMSAVWMAIAAGVPMLTDAFAVTAFELRKDRDDVPMQRELSAGLGLATGILLEHRFRRKLGKQLEQNKYDLGMLIDREVKRVRTLDIDQAFAEFFAGRTFHQWPGDVMTWSDQIRPLAHLATDRTYIYGTGWDNGRPLDATYVSGAAVRAAAEPVANQLRRDQPAVASFVTDPNRAKALLPALRNGIGTRLIKAQVKADQGEASGANLKRAMWFSLPIWGFGLIDFALRK